MSLRTSDGMSAIILEEETVKLNRAKNENDRIKKLSVRSSHCVCKFCGNKLSLRKVTYAAYDEAKIDIYCETCQRMENGTEPLIYNMAAYFVDDMLFDYYPDLDDSESKRRMNIAVVCDILSWGLKNLNIIDDSGFTHDFSHIDAQALGEALLLSKSALENMRKDDSHDQ